MDGVFSGWMHQIEAQRAGLRELNELNFSRFDSRLTELSRVTDARFTQFQATMDARLVQAAATMDARLAQFEATIVGRLEAKIDQRTADLMK